MTILCLLLALSIVRATEVARYTPAEVRATEVARQTPHPETIDRIMAVIGAQTVTLSDVNAALAFGLIDPPPPGPDRIQVALDRLIDRDLMLVEVDRYQPPEPAPDAIAERVAALRQRLGPSFDRDLKSTGLSEDALRREVRDNLRLQIYMNQRFSGPQGEARARLIADWVAGLRRHTPITVLYLGR
jgi:hypothetical protein